VNTANLQMQGVLLAVAAVNRLLVERGLVSKEDLTAALSNAESRITSDESISDLISAPNRAAIVFPLRMLRHAIPGDADPSFSELARSVGEELDQRE
jgi:hypothetical protein